MMDNLTKEVPENTSITGKTSGSAVRSQRQYLFPCVVAAGDPAGSEEPTDWLSLQSFVPGSSSYLIGRTHSCPPSQTVATNAITQFQPGLSKPEHHSSIKSKKKHKVKDKKCHRPYSSFYAGSSRQDLMKKFGNRSNSVWLPEGHPTPNDTFRVHFKGDKDNIAFQTVYKYDIPLYRSSNHVLGCMSTFRQGSRHVPLRRYFMNVKPAEFTDEVDVFNISLHSISRPGFISLLSRSALTATTTHRINAEDQGSPSEMLQKRVADDPYDVSAWNELVCRQEGTTSSPAAASKTSKAVLDRKVSILERALQHNPRDLSIITHYMDVLRDAVDSSAISEKWAEFLKKNIHNLGIWVHYLLFHQSNVHTFSVNKVIPLYVKAFITIGSQPDGASSQLDSKQPLVVLIVMMLQLLGQSGYSERFVTLIQLLVELNFFRSPFLDGLSFQTEKELLESYWISQEPLFGEEGCQGWKMFVGRVHGHYSEARPAGESDLNWKKILCDQALDSDENEPNVSGIDKTKAWLALEGFRSRNHFHPFRLNSTEEAACDDPERLAVFDDFSRLLVRIPPSSQRAFLFSFLAACGVPSPASEVSSVYDSISPLSIQNVRLDFMYRRLLWDVGNYVCFDSFISGYSNSEKRHPWLYFVRNAVLQLIQVSEDETVGMLSLSWILYEIIVAESSRKACRGLCRSLLKHGPNRNFVPLWKVYLFLSWTAETATECLQRAETIIATQKVSLQNWFSSCLSITSFVTALVLGFYSTHLSAEQHASVYGLIGGLVDVGLSPALSRLELLRLRTRMAELLLEQLSSPGTSATTCEVPSLRYHFVYQVLCLEHMMSGPEACIARAESILSESASSGDMEPTSKNSKLIDIGQAVSSVLTNPVISRGVPFRRAWAVFEQLFRISPRDPLLHSNFSCWIGLGHQASRLRMIYCDLLSRSHFDPSVWAWSVAVEKRSLEVVAREVQVPCVDMKGTGREYLYPGMVNYLRSLYEKAINQRTIRHCPGLWLGYLELEAAHGGSVAAIKSIYYRSLQFCPWVKDIHIAAVKYLPTETERILDVVVEKELRLRTPLEEVEILIE